LQTAVWLVAPCSVDAAVVVLVPAQPADNNTNAMQPLMMWEMKHESRACARATNRRYFALITFTQPSVLCPCER
jgi:hypothetical protein